MIIKLSALWLNIDWNQMFFSHIFTEGSILVDPDFQGMGIGSKIISTFLKEIEEKYPEVLRVEIIAKETNPAIKLY